jgi:hypothetical protein
MRHFVFFINQQEYRQKYGASLTNERHRGKNHRLPPLILDGIPLGGTFSAPFFSLAKEAEGATSISVARIRPRKLSVFLTMEIPPFGDREIVFARLRHPDNSGNEAVFIPSLNL